MIRLELDLTLEYEVLGPDGADFIFNVHAAKTAHQIVVAEKLSLSQRLAPQMATDHATGTRFMRMHAQTGPLTLRYEATLDLKHHRARPGTLQEVPVTNLPLDVMQYVLPSRYCQSDRLFNFAFREFGALPKGHARVAGIRQWVQDHVRFESNTSDGSTSALDTLVSGVGVCRDFTHLFIALCRALNIPARVATGTDYGADPALGPPDLHAYAEVYLSDRWYLCDPSGTGVPMGFMRFGAGRDAADVAFATMFGAVRGGPPLIAMRALQGPGLELPVPCADVLSTAALEQAGTDRSTFEGPAPRAAAARSHPLAH